MTDMYDAAMMNVIAHSIIPNLPDCTHIPDSSWPGWEPVLTELSVDRSNEQAVKDTIGRCQAMVTSLLATAMQQQQQGELAAQHMPGGAEGQVTASQLQLTQMLGSAGEQQVLLHQPKARIISRAKMTRGDRLEYWYQLAFEGFPESDADWYPAHKVRAAYPNGDELIRDYERGVQETGEHDVQVPPAAIAAAEAEGAAGVQLPGAMALGADAVAAGVAVSGGMPAAGSELAVGTKRGREDDAAGDDDVKRQRPEDHAGPAAAAAAAAEVATSAGMTVQLGANGQLFAMTGADGQPMLQVVPLQVPDASGLGQLDLSQLAGLDPQTLQALQMQQLVLHVPAGTQGLQLAMPAQVAAAPSASHPGREAVVAYVKDAVKLLMHSSEELQRKKRQQSRRSELNQRRAMLLPDGSAAPGALPTTAAGTPAPPLVRPTNMLAAIQALPPAEKRAMLISALRRALPVMMQTAQPKHLLLRDESFGTTRIVGKDNIINSAFFASLREAIPALVSRDSSEATMAAAAAAESEAMLQYSQLLAAQGGQGMTHLIAVPVPGTALQSLVPISAEQLQSMGGMLDASGQLVQGVLPADQAMAAAAAAANPALYSSMSLLTPEQLQALVAADPTLAALADPAAIAAAAAAAAAGGIGVPGELEGAAAAGEAGAAQAQLPAEAAAEAAAAAVAATMAGQDAAGGAALLAYDPNTAAALAAAAAAGLAIDGSLVQPVGDAAQDAAGAAAAAAAAAEPGSGGVAAPSGDGASAVPAAEAEAPAGAAGGMLEAAAAAGAPAAGAAASGAGQAKPREDEAVLAAISLTSLSRMPGPGEEGAAEGAAATPAGDAGQQPAAAGAPGSVAAPAEPSGAAAVPPAQEPALQQEAPGGDPELLATQDLSAIGGGAA